MSLVPGLPSDTYPGPTNSLHDVAGVRVGHAQRSDAGWLSGTTCVLAPRGGAVGGVDVRGGGPGTRETDLLDPRNMVDRVHAVVLTGGSAYGLAAATGVANSLGLAGEGFPVGRPGEVVPIVPAAVIFDLGRGGDFTARPDARMGTRAYEAAIASHTDAAPEEGSVGAGTGAIAGGLKGGAGSASAVLPDGSTVAALAVVNSLGSCVDPSTGLLYALPFGLPGDRLPVRPADEADLARARARAAGLNERFGVPRYGMATTIGVVATDATLTKAQCQKLAGVAHDGMARAIRPVHTMMDGDTVFTLATGDLGAPGVESMHLLLTAAADCFTRAVGRAILAAHTVEAAGVTWRCYREAFGSVFEPAG